MGRTSLGMIAAAPPRAARDPIGFLFSNSAISRGVGTAGILTHWAAGDVARAPASSPSEGQIEQGPQPSHSHLVRMNAKETYLFVRWAKTRFLVSCKILVAFLCALRWKRLSTFPLNSIEFISLRVATGRREITTARDSVFGSCPWVAPLFLGIFIYSHQKIFQS